MLDVDNAKAKVVPLSFRSWGVRYWLYFDSHVHLLSIAALFKRSGTHSGNEEFHLQQQPTPVASRYTRSLSIFFLIYPRFLFPPPPHPATSPFDGSTSPSQPQQQRLFLPDVQLMTTTLTSTDRCFLTSGTRLVLDAKQASPTLK